MRGDLRQSSLAVLIRHLYAERKSGVLHLARQSIRKRLHFNKGILIFADDGEQSPVPSSEQAASLLCSLFTWTSGEFSFEEGVSTIDDKMAFSEPPAELILEGNRSIDDTEILERLLGNEESVFACAQTTELPLFKTKLAPAESAVLKFAREKARFERSEIPHVTSEAAMLRALNALVSVGLIEIVEKSEATPEPVPQAAPPQPQPPPPAQPEPPASAEPIPVFEAEVVPVESDPELMFEPPSEVEQLLNAYEAKRTGTAPPPKPQPAPAAPPLPTPSSPPPEATVPPAVEPPAPRPPEVAASPSADEPPAMTPAAAPLPVETPSEPPAVETPGPEVSRPAPPSRAASPTTSTSKTSWTEAIARAIPEGKRRVVAGAAAGVGAITVVLVLLLSSGGDDPTESDAVVAAAPAASEPAPEPEPEPSKPLRSESTDDAAEPSEAELFYRANVAYEQGDYEMSKAALMLLLERQPDFTAARELMVKVDRALAPPPEPRLTTTTSTRPSRRVVQQTPSPKPETTAPRVEPTESDPARLLAEAVDALARREFDTAQAKLDALREIDPVYPGAWKLREGLSDERWKATLPLAFTAKHDHRFGSCDGVLTLTSGGIGYRSDDHTWFWSFSNLGKTERRDAKHIQLETQDGKNYKFDLREPVSGVDWTKFLELAR